MSKVLAEIQAKIKAPKDKENTFGKYKYRNAESILAAFKEVQPAGVALIMSDEIALVGARMFLVATATLTADGVEVARASSAAMHATEKKGMDDAQITGACSSYARKYALCGLFAIDDSTDDPDAGEATKAPKRQDPPNQEPPARDPVAIAAGIIAAFSKAQTNEALTAVAAEGTKAAAAWDWLVLEHKAEAARVRAAFDARKAELAQKEQEQ